MVKNFWLLNENHDNKVDENAMGKYIRQAY